MFIPIGVVIICLIALWAGVMGMLYEAEQADKRKDREHEFINLLSECRLHIENKDLKDRVWRKLNDQS